MNSTVLIEITNTLVEENYRVFNVTVSIVKEKKNLQVYVFNNDLPSKGVGITVDKLNEFVRSKVAKWIEESNGKLPIEPYLVLINGGRVKTDNIQSFLSAERKVSDLVRTNITISAPLFEWAKTKAQKEGTSFSDLVSRGLITLKESDKEVDVWYKTQGAYFRKKLGDFGSFEVFHYLPNNYIEFKQDTLKSALEKAEVKRTGWPIGAYLTGGDQRPHVQEDGIKAEYVPVDDLLLDYWYAKNKGEFYFSRNLESDSGRSKDKPKTSLYFDTLIWRVAEALEHSVNYYLQLGIDKGERVKIKLSLHGLNNRALSAWNPMRAIALRHYTCGSDKSSWEVETSLNDLKENLDEVIYEAVKKLLVMFDFFVPNKDVVADIINREYRKSNF